MTSDDHYLSPDKAFVTMSYINLFNLMLSYLPLAIFFTGQVRRHSVCHIHLLLSRDSLCNNLLVKTSSQ